jgi:pimeloyl-ACP methyl ester carboxylesterase
MTESFRSADGLTLQYHRLGDGPLLVCHPGGPGFSSGYFAGDLGGLDELFTLILLDPRGTAESERPANAEAYSTDEYAADVEALRVALDVEQLNLLGHSHGGVVAAAYAAEHPALVRRLVLANSLARLHPEEMERLKATHADEPWYEDSQQALEQELAGEFESPEELRDLAVREFAFYFAHYDDGARAFIQEHVASELPNTDALKWFNERIDADQFDLRPSLPRIQASTLIITGEADFICGPACASDFAEGITGAEKLVVTDCGHFTYYEQPGRWREALRRFVQ